MGVATTLAITTSLAASTAASNAAHQDRQARISSCKAFELSYDSKLASLEQKQEYASCMQLLYPWEEKPMTADEIIASKGVVIIFLLALVVGLVKGYREDGIPAALLLGAVFPIAVGLLMLAAVLIFCGVRYIFS